MKNNRTGFSILAVVLTIGILGIMGTLGWYAYHAYTQNTKNTEVPHKLATLSGTVTKGPTSPVARPGDSGNAVVADHGVQAISADGKVAASTKTDSQGKYTLKLLPGQYALVLNPQVGMGIMKNNTTKVVPGENNLDLTADTGIR